MDLAQHYLAKYKTLTPPQASKAKIIAAAIEDECGVTLVHTEIEIRRGGAVLSCHPTTRSEVMRCAPTILETLYSKHKIRLSFLR
jgi:hypothetical protein